MTGKEVFAARLKALRKERKITQYEFAQFVDIAPRTIKNWEGGVNIPPVEMLCKVADYFGVSLDYLLGRNDERP